MQRGTWAAAPATAARVDPPAGTAAPATAPSRACSSARWAGRDASKQGKAWNADERAVGKIRRIPLEGLAEGLDASVRGAGGPQDHRPLLGGRDRQGDRARPCCARRDRGVDRGRGLPARLTEGRHRPYAGWRQLVEPEAVDRGDLSAALKERLPRLRQGIDATDTAPVRDVALDQVEQQLEESGQTQLVIVLPQGGLKSQFSKGGRQDFDAGNYVKEIVTRLRTEQRWRDGAGKTIDAEAVGQARHDGRAQRCRRRALEHGAPCKAKRGQKPPRGAPPPAGPALTGDLVIYDAINGSQLESFKAWTAMRLDKDLAFLTERDTITDEAKLYHLQSAQKLRGFTTGYYIDQYIALDQVHRGLVRAQHAQARRLGALPARELRAGLPARRPRGADARLARRVRRARRGRARSSRRSGTSTRRATARRRRARRCPSR